jgi:cytochrome P450
MNTVDLYDPSTQENPYQAYETLRTDAPVYLIPGTNMYVVSRYADIVEISRRTSVFAQGPAPGEALVKDPGALQIYRDHGIARPDRVPLSTDPPVHRRYRSMVDGFFSARAAERQRGLIAEIANDLIDQWIDSDEIEFVSQFAKPLPVSVITVMMGFPMEAVPDLRRWSDAWVMPFAGRLSAERERYVAEQGVEFQRYILSTIEAKRRNPDDSVLSHFGNAEFRDIDGSVRPLTDAELVYMVDQLHTGGNETTTFALTSALWLMLSNPEIHRRLRAHHSLIPNFVDECLRLESPTQGMFRHAVEDVELHGVLIPKGATVHLRFAAANRDDRFFDNPAEIDLDRTNGHRHVAFGQGEHHCAGAGLARLEQNVAFEILLDRVGDWWLAPGKNDFAHKPGFVLRALEELHVGIAAAERPGARNSRIIRESLT